MPRPRIFISHSTKDTLTQGFLKKLYETLSLEVAGERRFEVLLDKTELELGKYWRSTLNVWIGGCDAAIVLLSESALQSHYVSYEASILCHRRSMNPDFLLFPIYIVPDRKKLFLESPPSYLWGQGQRLLADYN